jgi:hypothetical protein
MLLHINGKFTLGKLKSCLIVVSLTAPYSISSHRSSYEADLSVSVVSFISTIPELVVPIGGYKTVMVDNISTHNNNKPHQKCKEKHKKS